MTTQMIDAMLSVDLSEHLENHAKNAKVAFSHDLPRHTRAANTLKRWYHSAKYHATRGLVRVYDTIDNLIRRFNTFLWRHDTLRWTLAVFYTIMVAALAYVLFIMAVVAWWMLILFVFF
jgi:hypothetical protein